MSHKHKKEAWIATALLLLAIIGTVAFFFVDSFRFYVEDSYHAIFKTLITDRVLKDQAGIHSNISYCNSDNPRQTLDLYIPQASSTAPHKLIIFIHGGAWRSGDKSTTLLSDYGEDMLKADVAIAALNYRLYPEVSYPKQNDDIACALSYLSRHADEYNLVSNNWAVFGDSAGAELGAYAMSDERVNGSLSLFIGFYGPYDLAAQIDRTPNPDIPARDYTNGGRDSNHASPMFRPGKKDAKYILFHGEKDRIVHISQSENFYNKLKSEGIDVSFTRVQNAGHYFSSRTNPSSEQISDRIISSFSSR